MEERQLFDLPGVGETRVRPGTSAASLAGMAHFWHRKYQHAWRDGFISACIVLGLAGTAAGISIWVWF